MLDNLVEEGEIVEIGKNLDSVSSDVLKVVNSCNSVSVSVFKEDEFKKDNSSNLKRKGSNQLKGLGPINLALRSRRADGEGKDKLGTFSLLFNEFFHYVLEL
ncbi:hypothetical protein KFK09_022800 [Dendrobium nobile]|uniref:Uncharacterized protein n=1 Tax=Dendrobium nobile TaxID=94219 RepID=A0A8T3AJT1_DENNO|nr:hypothetical protein KFK09_022800 [Dendrobium nobile]